MTEAADENFGPAMSALTGKQRAFVQHYVAAGGKRGGAAARAAGYSKARGRSCAYELLRNPKVKDAIREHAEHSLDARSIMASVLALKMLEDDLQSDNPRARQHAINAILDRTGYARRVTQEVAVTVDGRTTRELIAEIQQLTAQKRGDHEQA